MKISVCIGSACHLRGSYNVINSLQQLIEEYKLSEEVEVQAAFCLGKCSQASSVSVRIDNREVQNVSGSAVRQFFVEAILPEATKI